VALLYVDLDRFKVINDTLGHAAGDELLVHVGDRLRSCIRDEDRAGRLGGDEFAVMLGQLPPDAADEVAVRVAERALALLSEPVLLDGTEQTVGASIGIAISRCADVDSEALVAHADAAMYEAKRAGRGTAVLSRPALNGAA
jgi:diguanylate cyclase (GGDEF)-like protein